MARSKDPKTGFPLPAERGAKRTGPIGTIIPGDDPEVARDIQRLWFAIQGLRGKQCCDSGGSVTLPPGGIVAGSSDIEGAYTSPPSRLGWWRLGENVAWPAVGSSGTVANAYADSSGAGHPLSAVVGGAVSSYDRPTGHVPGAVGAADDGGIRFNTTYYPWTAPFSDSGFSANASFGAGETSAGFTLVAWVKFVTPTMMSYAPFTAPIGAVFPIISTYYRSFGGGSSGGFSLALDPLGGKIAYRCTPGGGAGIVTRYETPFGLVRDRWYHVAVVWQNLGSGNYERRFYLNLNKLFSEAGTAVALGGNGASGAVLSLGGGWMDDIRFTPTACGLDEVAMYQAALTGQQLAAIYRATSPPGTSGEATTVEIGAGSAFDPYAIHSGDATKGQVMTATGDGGTEWLTPSGVPVYKNGA